MLGLIGTSLVGSPSAPDIQPLSSDWKLQDAAKVSATPEQVSQAAFQATDWYPATVPGTVLTSLVNYKVYPEPLYGENNRPDKIPESLCRSSYWYRTSFSIPEVAPGRSIWLNFDGINYSADVWVNGVNAGSMKGAFARGSQLGKSFATPVAMRVTRSMELTESNLLRAFV